jgi:hypothetical protein
VTRQLGAQVNQLVGSKEHLVPAPRAPLAVEELRHRHIDTALDLAQRGYRGAATILLDRGDQTVGHPGAGDELPLRELVLLANLPQPGADIERSAGRASYASAPSGSVIEPKDDTTSRRVGVGRLHSGVELDSRIPLLARTER